MFDGLLKMTGEVVLETLWPTRCAICDIGGEEVLCASCERSLLLNDACKACSRCCAPFGRIQCTECNDMALSNAGLDRLPVDTMAHAMVATDEVTRIIKIYKDNDERRLLHYIASRIAAMISPDRKHDGTILTYVPDTARAQRRRGFDHAEEIARYVTRLTGIECASMFETPKSIDQRKLDKKSRIANMRGALHVKDDCALPRSVLLIDDVCTTGATIYSAALSLKAAGVRKVHAATFAKV